MKHEAGRTPSPNRFAEQFLDVMIVISTADREASESRS
jgi:hypothetical protein